MIDEIDFKSFLCPNTTTIELEGSGINLASVWYSNRAFRMDIYPTQAALDDSIFDDEKYPIVYTNTLTRYFNP